MRRTPTLLLLPLLALRLRGRKDAGAALRVARGGTMHWVHLAAPEVQR